MLFRQNIFLFNIILGISLILCKVVSAFTSIKKCKKEIEKPHKLIQVPRIEHTLIKIINTN